MQPLDSPNLPITGQIISPPPPRFQHNVNSRALGIQPAEYNIDHEYNFCTNDGSNESAKDEEAIPELEVGMTAVTKDLYREDPRERWEEWAPEDLGIEPKTASATNKFALIVRREKQNGDTDEPVLGIHSITINSPLLKSQLGTVFAEYQGVNTNLKHLTFNAPFHEFFYRWAEFVKAKPDPEEDSKSVHYKLLFDIIASEITPHIDRAEDLLNNKVISFDYLWALFQPGTEIYSRIDDQDRLYLLVGSRYQSMGGMKFFSLTCCYVETDGNSFGFTTTQLSIGDFENVKPISDLNVLPFHLHENSDEIRKKLVSRGRKFEQLRGFHHVSYEGFYNFHKVPFSSSRKRYIQYARVIIDCGSFMRYNPDCHVQLDPLSEPPPPRHLDVLSTIPGMDVDDGDQMIYTPPSLQTLQEMARHTRRRFASSRQNLNASQSLSENTYIYCSPIVKGFCLHAKKWVYMYVDSVKDIEWSSGAFERLVLPQDYKRIVWAFVEAQINHSDSFDDLVRGKGKGFIMLLSGEPGTGKTLTAESVSESMKKPLYSLSAGELGKEAGEVEKNLQKVLELATKWGAVLLIDECDVFMVKRSASDIKRNQLVSVFLRLLEYYQGVMLLTTNRIDSFDPAFESRIHLTINYPKLDHPSRLHVWKTFIGPTGSNGSCASATDITEQDLQRVAEEELNGRQIKNIVKTARLLAAGDREALGLDHIETVLRVKRGDRAYLGQ